MAKVSKSWFTRFGIDVEGDSTLADTVNFLGSITFGAAGRFFAPAGSGTGGATNQLRISTFTNQLEIYRNGAWSPAVINALRWDNANTRFRGDNGAGELTIPHVSNTGNLENVNRVRTTERGTSNSPALSCGDNTNSGYWAASATQLDFGVNGSRRYQHLDNATNMFIGGTQVSRITSTLSTFHVASAFNSTITVTGTSTFNGTTVQNALATFNAALTVASGDLTVSTGRILAGSNVVAYSDKRIKSDIKTVSNALQLVNSMRGVEYDNLLTGAHEFGFIAQEVQEVNESLVVHAGDVVLLDGSKVNDTKAVSYTNVIPLLVESIKQLTKELEELKGNKQ